MHVLQWESTKVKGVTIVSKMNSLWSKARRINGKHLRKKITGLWLGLCSLFKNWCLQCSGGYVLMATLPLSSVWHPFPETPLFTVTWHIHLKHIQLSTFQFPRRQLRIYRLFQQYPFLGVKLNFLMPNSSTFFEKKSKWLCSLSFL